MPRKVFVAGEILTAADVNTNLMDQAVMVFDDATARATAIPTPVEGMVTYLKDEDEVTVFDGSAFKAVGPGKILQVVSATKTDTFTAAAGSTHDIPDLVATMTPSATSSKILIFLAIGKVDGNGTRTHNFVVTRNSAAVGIPPASGDRLRMTSSAANISIGNSTSVAFNFLDSPSSTSALTYQATYRPNAGTGFINRDANNADLSTTAITVSTITLMEVAG